MSGQAWGRGRGRGRGQLQPAFRLPGFRGRGARPMDGPPSQRQGPSESQSCLGKGSGFGSRQYTDLDRPAQFADAPENMSG